MVGEFDQLKLENQLCFPLYAASRMLTRLYIPLLKELDITYPQYLVLLVLWEKDPCSVSEITQKIHLETNTVTPLLKRLEQKGILKRTRSSEDERRVFISLTEKGRVMQSQAADIPLRLAKEIGAGFGPEKAIGLKKDLEALIASMT